MNKEKLIKRLDDLQKEFEATRINFEKSRAQLEMLHGAILDTQFWLAELDNPAEAPMVEPVKD